VFRDALRACPDAPPGSVAVLLDNKGGRPIARGFYDPTGPLAFRACNVADQRPVDDAWAVERFEIAWQLRRQLFVEQACGVGRTTGFRLFNGEGDGLPGLVVDVYADTAVLKLDGAAPRAFWDAEGIATWIAGQTGVSRVCERLRERGAAVRMLLGVEPCGPVEFMENGLRFTADVVAGQKTGFFLDQRDNRLLVRQFAAGTRVLNLFGYTGGFSVAAGCGGASHVTTVDAAQPAIAAADEHWTLNGLPPDAHRGECRDVFEFLTEVRERGQRWDLVISDPPSFAPSQTSVPKALSAYQTLAREAAAVTDRRGLLALASCSSHVSPSDFLRTIEEGIAQARRRAIVLGLHGQPPDHPTPLALPEFRYLKFVLLRLD
jgi:23S rRNA (cytosine1962-C5)-methyltransferase